MLKVNRKKYKILAAVGMGTCLIAGGTSAAYLKDAVGEVQNVITVGNIKAVLEEPHWNPEKKMYLHPGESTQKDPVVKNTGLNEEYAFLEVRIPKREIAVVNDDTKMKMNKESRAVFTFEAEKGWELVRQEEQEDQQVYVYGYPEILKPGEKRKKNVQKRSRYSKRKISRNRKSSLRRKVYRHINRDFMKST